KVITSDCPVGARRRRFGLGVIALTVAGTAASALSLVSQESVEIRCPNAARGHDERRELAPGPREQRDEEEDRGGAGTTGLVAPPEAPAGKRTTGCACLPGDPLCDCL